MNGYQVILDFCNVPRELCNNDKKIANVLAIVAENIGADVLSMNRYRFVPPAEEGCTVMLTLDASHLSAHSYATKGLLAVDAFISGNREKAEKCSEQIIDELQLSSNIAKREIVERFTSTCCTQS